MSATTPTSAQDLQLERRYRAIDFVAEFQRYWSYFNQWFKVEAGTDQDRRAIEFLKGSPRIKGIIDKLARSPVDQRLTHNMSIPERDFYTYLSENLISGFVRACWDNPRIRARLNLFNSQSVDRVRGSTAIHLTTAEYRAAYGHVTESLDRHMSLGQLSMPQVMSRHGVRYVGSCFFRSPAEKFKLAGDASQEAHADDCWNRIEADNSLQLLVKLKNSPIAPGLCSDIMEMLYAVRNGANHGDLDFLDDNEVARTALLVLDSIIRRIIGLP